MSPQRLDDAFPGEQAHFGHGWLQERPSQLFLVGQVISTWAYAEAHLGGLLSRLIDGQSVAMMAMFSEIHGFTSQKNVVSACARSVLKGEELDAVLDLLCALQPFYEIRNQFAHNLWGIVPAVDGVLVMLHQRVFWAHVGERQALLDEAKENFSKLAEQKPPNIDRTKVTVYTPADLMAAVDDMHLAVDLIGAVIDLTSDYPSLKAHRIRQVYQQPQMARCRARRLKIKGTDLAS